MPIGETKIAVEAETESYKFTGDQLAVGNTYEFEITKPFLSLGQTRSYYERMVALISDVNERERLLDLLHDVIFLEHRLPNRSELLLRSQEVFTHSLLRSSSAVQAYGEGKSILFSAELAANRFDFETQTTLLNQPRPISMRFRFERDDDDPFPTSIAVIVGRNGLGKTQTLYAIQSMFLGVNSPNKQVELSPALIPTAYRSVIAVAFSPFENFPTHHAPSPNGEVRYVYCGFRNVEGDWSRDRIESSIGPAFTNMILAEISDSKIKRPRLAMFTRSIKDALGTSQVKVKMQEHNQPVDFSGWALSNPDRTRDRLKVQPIQTEQLFFDDLPYANLSAGQKMFVLVAVSLCSIIEPSSLLLIDEPELYLHPNLECAFVTMIQTILQLFESYAVIATHSVFVVREVPSRCVTILRQTETDGVIATKPQINTFGGDLNLIADYVFDNVASRKPYEDALDQMASGEVTFEQIRQRYGPKLGFDALGYLRQKLEARGKND